MIGDVEDVHEVFKTRKYFLGHLYQDYKGSTEFYSINEFTVTEFKEKYGENIVVNGIKMSLNYILNAMNNVNSDTIVLIGDPAVNFIHTILV